MRNQPKEVEELLDTSGNVCRLMTQIANELRILGLLSYAKPLEDANRQLTARSVVFWEDTRPIEL